MDTVALKQFVTLAESLHFGRAARLSHISPSALSRAIQRLEDELDVSLFRRNNRQVSLTHEGSVFLEYARSTLGDWDAVRHHLMEESAELHGTISMYCSVTASYSFLFDLLTRFREAHPQVLIKLHTGDPEDAISHVLEGTEDIAIGARPERMSSELAFRRTVFSPLVFIAAAGSKDTPESSPMILPERGLARERTDAWFRSRGQAADVYAQVAGNEAIVSMVSLGFGVGVVPQIVLDNSPLAETVRVLSVNPALEKYEVGLFALRRRLENPIIRAFWSQLRPQAGL